MVRRNRRFFSGSGPGERRFTPVTRVEPSVGAEQEYFLIDRAAYDQRLDLKLCGTIPVGGQEGVQLAGGDAGHGLEPVGKVGGPLLQSPLLHGVGHRLGS